jgi:hypothetical protein
MDSPSVAPTRFHLRSSISGDMQLEQWYPLGRTPMGFTVCAKGSLRRLHFQNSSSLAKVRAVAIAYEPGLYHAKLYTNTGMVLANS